MFAHASEDRSQSSSGDKVSCIRDIWAAGAEVEYQVLGVFETHAEALEAERAHIERHAGLTNCARYRNLRERVADLICRVKPSRQWLAESARSAKDVEMYCFVARMLAELYLRLGGWNACVSER